MAVIYLCPVDKRLSCSWEGSASDIKQHFENEHNELLYHTNYVQIDLNDLPQSKLLHIEEKIFLMQIFQSDYKIIIKLRYLGSCKDAKEISYSIAISVGESFYKYDTPQFSYLLPTNEGWEVNLQSLQNIHGKLNNLICTLLLEQPVKYSRKVSTTSLHINNSYIEKNVCDEMEAEMLEILRKADKRIDKLKKINKKNGDMMDKVGHTDIDFMDKVSQLNFDILEEPFPAKNEEPKTEFHFQDNLPNIPEEINMSCSSCKLDMLPPILLCFNGHNICAWCKSKPCQICNSVVTVQRNTDLENISRTHLHRCRFASEGCNEKLFYNEVRNHESKCYFCKYKCLLCNYAGKFEHFVNHVKVVHSSVKQSTSVRNEFPKNTQLYIINHSIGIFYCESEIKGDAIFWNVSFCGPNERSFFCELTFKGSKFKEPIFLKRKGTSYQIEKTLFELKKNKAKDKYAVLLITSYDS